MREIKFRAWNNKFNKMESSVTPAPDGSGDIWGLDEEAKAFEHWEGNKSAFVLMQFTGLHDKNGKEIWEGDILSPSNAPFGESGNNTEVKWNEFDGRWHPWAMWFNKCEVLGNIHEHPELLGASNGS